MKSGQAYVLRKAILTLKSLVQAGAKSWLHTEGLQNKYTHPYDALLCRVILVLEGVEQNEHHEVVSAIRVNDE